MPWQKRWAPQIDQTVREYVQDPERYRRMRSAGDYQRARLLSEVFPAAGVPAAINIAGVRTRLNDNILNEHVSLLLRADPDLLNLAAEALEYCYPDPSTIEPLRTEPAYMPELRKRLKTQPAPDGSELAPDRFFSFLFKMNAFPNWGAVIAAHEETLENVVHQELDQVAVSRRLREVRGPAFDSRGSANERAESAYLMGLAFSGGGIRSATVCLGVLQALAQLRMSTWFDYLSTVSGGGYIGSWFVSWIQRCGRDTVREQLSPEDAALPSDERQDTIRFLRRYSNYLTPEIGFFSADTWTLIAIWLRNVVLNLGTLIPAFFVLLVLPRVLVRLFIATSGEGTWALVMSFALFLWAAVWIGRNLRNFDCRRNRAPGSAGAKPPNTQSEIQRLIIIPLLISAWMSAAYVSSPNRDVPPTDVTATVLTGVLTTVLLGGLAWMAGSPGAIWILLVSLGVAWSSIYFAFAFGIPHFLSSHFYTGILVTGSSFAVAFFMLALMAGYHWCFLNEKGKLKTVQNGVWLTRAILMLIFICLVCGIAGGALHLALGAEIGRWPTARPEWFFLSMAWGPELIALGTMAIVVLFLGLSGRAFPDDRREWWSRIGAWLGIYGLGWTAWMLFSLYGPFLVDWAIFKLPGWLSGTITVGWVFTTISGLIAAKSKQAPSAGSASSGKLDLLINVAPYVFIVGLLLGISYGAHRLISWQTCGTELPALWSAPEGPLVPNPKPHKTSGNTLVLSWEDDRGTRMTRTWLAAPAFPAISIPSGAKACLAAAGASSPPPAPDYAAYWDQLRFSSTHIDATVIDLLAAAVIMLLLAWKVDINEFSMHHFYRNRLIRCYLGASGGRGRKANPFTGLDFNDDIPLARFKAREHLYEGPFPIVNTAINLSQSANLAFQERKASSFAITPLYSGFQPTDAATGRDDPARKGYRPTERFAYQISGPHLGTAMAISGAAASPNWGFHTSSAMAFLMTVFNVRLGWWVGNPLRNKWRKSGPPLNLGYLACELVGLTNDSRKYVYLSDGGHFDNLGLYELIRRRCRFIVVVDAEEDASFSFEGLGMSIRKCRIDFGVEIDLNLDRIRKRTEGNSQAHCAVGDVWFPPLVDGGPKMRGAIVYVKSTLTGDEESDIVEYKAKHDVFPHQTTGDQFFDESQFESYRKLGLHMGLSTFGRTPPSGNDLEDRVRYIVQLRQRWLAPRSAKAKSFSSLSASLERLWERLRSDTSLAFLTPQLYPEWRTLAAHTGGAADTAALDSSFWLPHDETQMRSGFYFCMEAVQLMENVYLDLNLDAECDHPDNRGWMNLFRHWSHSDMMRVSWAASAATYGARFQTFCRDRLGLDLGEVDLLGPMRDAQQARAHLNSYERQMIRNFRSKVEANIRVYSLGLVVKPQVAAARTTAFRLPFAFALVQDGKLLAYRVQDHLRQMGFGRRGLARLTQRQAAPPVVEKDQLAGAAALRTFVPDTDLDAQMDWEHRTLRIALDQARAKMQ